MIKKISLENFMAHAATSLELSPGVTVITGPNNIGKSAVVEGLRFLLYNPPPKHVIRHGAKEALVRLELDSGEIITWRRQDKHAAYSLQQPGQPAEDYHKFGREVPDDIRSLLRLEQVVTDTGDRIDIHLGNQREPIFLLDRPGSHAAGFFAASTEADYLLKMQQVLKRRTEQANRDRKFLQAELAALATELAQLEPLAAIDLLIQQAEALYEAIVASQRQLPILQDLSSQMAQLAVRRREAATAAEILAALESPPVLAPTAGLAQLLAEIAATTGQQAWQRAQDTILTGLTPPPTLALTATLEESVVAISSTWANLETALAQDRILKQLAAPPALEATRELAELHEALAQTYAQWHREGMHLAALQDMQPPPQMAVIGELPQLIQNLRSTASNLDIWQRCRSMLEQAAPPPDLFDLSTLTTLTQEMAVTTRQGQRQQQYFGFLANLPPPPELVEVAHLEETWQRLSQEMADLRREKNVWDRLRQALEQQRAAINDYLQEVGVCPLCGSPLDLSHFLEEPHA